MKHTLTKLDYRIISDYMSIHSFPNGFNIQENTLIYFLEYYKKHCKKVKP